MNDETNQTAVLKPHLVLHEGQAMTTSMAVAEHFEKLHKNVLQSINNLECSSEFTELNFQLCFKTNELANGKSIPYYRMTRDGFTFLAMGFTGKKAAAWKEAYIAAFNRLEQNHIARLRAECSDREELAGYIMELIDRIKQLEGEARELRADHFELKMTRNRITGPEELGVMMILCDMRVPDAQLLAFLSRRLLELTDQRPSPVKASAGQLARAIGWTSEQQVRKALQRLEEKGLLDIIRQKRGHSSAYAVRAKKIEALLKAYREGEHGRLNEHALVPDAETPIAEMIRRIVGMPKGQHDDATERRIEERNLLPKQRPFKFRKR